MGYTLSAKRPRRDWVLMPVTSILTVAVIVIVLDFVANHIYTESRSFIATCMTSNDARTGGRARPNSVCRDKKFESDWVEYRFNSCGHRTDLPCGVKPAGTYRIVLVGSSVAMGHLVARENTMAALLPEQLSRRSGRAIDLYNEGMVSQPPYVLAQRFDEIIAAKPDLILWTLTPFDLGLELPNHDSLESIQDAGLAAKAKFFFAEAVVKKPLLLAIRDFADRCFAKVYKSASDTAAGTLMLHALYESRSQYIKSFLASGDNAGFLHKTFSEEWISRLRQFDIDAGNIADRAKEAGLPLVVTLVPNRAQAAMISSGQWPPDTDPYKLDRIIREVIEKHGGVYLEISPNFAQAPDAEKNYFPIDGHPNPNGQALIAGMLANALSSGEIAALKGGPSTTYSQSVSR